MYDVILSITRKQPSPAALFIPRQQTGAIGVYCLLKFSQTFAHIPRFSQRNPKYGAPAQGSPLAKGDTKNIAVPTLSTIYSVQVRRTGSYMSYPCTSDRISQRTCDNLAQLTLCVSLGQPYVSVLSVLWHGTATLFEPFLFFL
jgi:hypothetical protein